MVRKLHVLVIEEEPLLAMDLDERLESAGLAVFEARSANRGVPILETRTDIRVVITDVDFVAGHLSGLDLARLGWGLIGHTR